MSISIIDASFRKFTELIEERGLFNDVSNFLILFSCGKDCSMLLDLFIRYYNERNISQKYSVFSVPFPKHMYYDNQGNGLENFISIKRYWASRNISIDYVTPEFDDFKDDDRFGCKVCKKARKTVLDKYINTFEKTTGVLTGFTMYDSLAYISMILLTCNYDLLNLDKLPENIKNTTTKMLHKMSLKENLPNGKIFIRPMLPYSENEVSEYLKIRQIPYLTTPCKIKKYKFKRLYSSALDLFSPLPTTYDGIEQFLLRNGIQLNKNGLSFDDVEEDNFFIDC